MDDLDEYSPDGIAVKVDLSELIEEVKVSPTAGRQFYEKVKTETRERGYEYPVRRSVLSGEAIF